MGGVKVMYLGARWGSQPQEGVDSIVLSGIKERLIVLREKRRAVYELNGN